ncbi:hypothetical protein H6F67_12330 [Microcoleus sp. FACHB-1515]|uniref:hypothetical protein n=1 Tax=Cyanophyceae TaxID=3028117 RepID=UPI0016837326|nr:hypothetical protein [Microcoleus sp. FACHB-1515]MBD2090641.1 hypothetical protein [Microcoleus sp. FACHB-1515]
MAILVANIGTSDISVKIGDYYIPIGFDRSEPNIVEPEEDSPEAAVWVKNRRREIQSLYRELGFQDSGDPKWSVPFRDLTQRLLAAYTTEPDIWHDRILPGRLWGVIEAALQFPLTEVHLFITNQLDEEADKRLSDTVYLFELIQQWLKTRLEREGRPLLAICGVAIEFKAIDQDKLLSRYYDFFKDRPANEELLLSIKGGTPQMQTALRVQANAVGSQYQISLEPRLVISDVLHGKPSKCDRISLWRYTRIQKYQAVERLLKRWDFAGAIALLEDWQEVLKFLKTHQVVDLDSLKQSSDRVEQMIQLTTFAKHQFNLDAGAAKRLSEKYRHLKEVQTLTSQYKQQNSPLTTLNLFTQCRIFWELDQIANFLPRLGSCCEFALETIIRRSLSGQPIVDSQWRLDVDRAKRLWDGRFWQDFAQRERSWFDPKDNRSKDNTNFINFERNLRDGKKAPYKLTGRYSKRNLAEALFSQAQQPQNLQEWEAVHQFLTQLDFWVALRNDLIHMAKGVSREAMVTLYQEETSRHKAVIRGLPNTKICPPEEILPTLSQIVVSPLIGLEKPLIQKFTSLTDDRYLYSAVTQSIQSLCAQDLL